MSAYHVDAIKNWVGNKVTESATHLFATIPDYSDSTTAQLTIIQSQINSTLDTTDAAIRNTEFGYLVSTLRELETLFNALEIEVIHNANKLEALRIEGQLKKLLATMRGSMKLELVNLENANNIAIALLEGNKDLELVQLLAPIEREGKVSVAIEQGKGDLAIAQIERIVELRIAQINGANKIELAKLDERIIKAENEVNVNSIKADNAVEIAGLQREAVTDAGYTLGTAQLEKGLKQIEASNEVAYIGQVSAIDVSATSVNSGIEDNAIRSTSNLEVSNIGAAAILSAETIAAMSQMEVSTKTVVTQLTTEIDIQSAVNETNARVVSAQSVAAQEAYAIHADGNLDSSEITHESILKVAEITNESNAAIAIEKNKSQSELEYIIKYANDEASNTLDILDLTLAYESDLYAVESEGKQAQADITIQGLMQKSKLEAAIDIAEGSKSVVHKSNMASLDLIKMQLSDGIKIEGSRSESAIQLQGANDLSTIKLATIGKENVIKIAAGHNESNLKIGSDDGETQLKLTASGKKQQIQMSELSNQTAIEGRQRDKESIYSDSYIRQSADASYDSVKMAADATYESSMNIVWDQVTLSQAVANFAIDCDKIILDNSIAAAKAKASAGKEREHISYVYKNSASSSPGIAYAEYPELKPSDPAPPLWNINTPNIPIDTDPKIEISDTINFE